MIDALQCGDERSPRFVELGQRQRALIQLSPGDAIGNDLADDLIQLIRRFGPVGAHRSFAAVRQHQQCGFFRLRLRPRITERRFVDPGCAVGSLSHGFLIKKTHAHRAVMFGNESAYPRRQAILLGELHALRHVTDDDLGAGARLELIMHVSAFHLILHKHIGAHGFAYIMVIRADARQQGICADTLCRLFGQIHNHQRVVIRARRFVQEIIEERVGRSGQLQQLHRRRHIKHTADQE